MKYLVSRDFLFGWTGSPDLPNSVAMMSLPVPSIIVINATSFHHHLPEEYIEILTPENLSEFLNRVLQNDIQVHLSDNHKSVIVLRWKSMINIVYKRQWSEPGTLIGLSWLLSCRRILFFLFFLLSHFYMRSDFKGILGHYSGLLGNRKYLST